VLLADASNDAILVMNVQTAIAPADDIAATVTGLVSKYRQQRRGSAKPVLAVWVGADQKIIDMLSGAGIPNYPTEDDAVRGFMHLVRHRGGRGGAGAGPAGHASELRRYRCRAADRCHGVRAQQKSGERCKLGAPAFRFGKVG